MAERRFVTGRVVGSGVIRSMGLRLRLDLWFESCGIQDWSFNANVAWLPHEPAEIQRWLNAMK